MVIEQFDQPVTDQQVRAALEPTFGQDLVINVSGDPSQRQMMIRVPEVGAEAGASLSTTAEKIEAALKASNLGAFKRLGTEIVGPAVGRELTNKAHLGDRAVDGRHSGLHLVPLSVELRGRRRGGHAARLARHLRVPRLLRLRPDAQRDCRAADHHRFFDQRHDRHFRSRAREPARRCAATASTT